MISGSDGARPAPAPRAFSRRTAAAQALPIIGAAAGALINLVFIDHFQDMSRGHFTIRRLERIYGAQQVRAAYERM